MHETTINGERAIIGSGEDTVDSVLHHILPTYWHIARQVPIESLITRDEFTFLDEVHQKHKVDFAIYIQTLAGERNYVGVIRVQGKDHEAGKRGIAHGDKSNKDRIQLDLFKNNKLWVVDILFRECPHIFKEEYSFDSIIEVCQMFKMAKVSLRG